MKRTFAFILVFYSLISFAQIDEPNWLTFEQLEQKMIEKPKKVMIHFYADWCNYCKKMEKVVYLKPKILEELNSNYYVIKFNVESEDAVEFGGRVFLNLNTGKNRRAKHQIAELLAIKNGESLTLPAVLFFNEDFILEKRLHRYIPPKELLTLLQE